MVKWRRLYILVLVLMIVNAGLFFTNNSLAEDAIFQAVVDDYLTITLDDSNMSVTVDAGNPFASGYVSATITTNGTYGYKLSFQDSDERNGLERAGYTTASSEDKPQYNIASVSADTDYANLLDDSWGYFLGDITAAQASFKQIPLSTTEIATADEPVIDDETRVNFGVKISSSRPGGLYEDELVFTAVNTIMPDFNVEQSYAAANKTKKTINGVGYYKMQDMTSDICERITIIPSETQVYDERDDKIYWIAKLEDGKCWMTQNLDLDLISVEEGETPLYNHWNTDLGWHRDTSMEGCEDNCGGYGEIEEDDEDATWNPSQSTTSVVSQDDIPDDDAMYEPRSTDVGDWYYTDQYYYITDKGQRNNFNFLKDGANLLFSTSPYSNNEAHGHVGNYYNWNAAIADNDTSSIGSSEYYLLKSICPAGWRLPHRSLSSQNGGKINYRDPGVQGGLPSLTEIKSSWGKFYSEYYDDTFGIKVFYNNGQYENSEGFESSPVYWIRAGTIRAGELSNAGFDGYYWTGWSSAYEDFGSDILIRSNIVDGSDHYYRDRQKTIRCVAR